MPQGINFLSDTGDTGLERQRKEMERERDGHKLSRQRRGRRSARRQSEKDLARGHSDGHGIRMGPPLSLSLICQESFRPCLPHSAVPIFRSNIRSTPAVSLSSKLNGALPNNLGRVRTTRGERGKGGGGGGGGLQLAGNGIHFEGREEMRARNWDGGRSGTMGRGG